MRSKTFLILALAIAAVFPIRNAEALVSPVGASVIPPLQFPPRGSSIIGARLNLFLGVHESVMGLDLGVVGNMTDRAFGGVQLAGVFNRNKGPTTIDFAQIAGLVNWNLNTSNIYGLQLAGGANINNGRSTLIGLAIAPIGNFAAASAVGGAQIGIINRARQVYGVQLGLLNIAEELHGLQLGLININRSGPLAFVPVVNIGL
jgi:hypothetical protein